MSFNEVLILNSHPHYHISSPVSQKNSMRELKTIHYCVEDFSAKKYKISEHKEAYVLKCPKVSSEGPSLQRVYHLPYLRQHLFLDECNAYDFKIIAYKKLLKRIEEFFHTFSKFETMIDHFSENDSLSDRFEIISEFENLFPSLDPAKSNKMSVITKNPEELRAMVNSYREALIQTEFTIKTAYTSYDFINWDGDDVLLRKVMKTNDSSL